MPHKFFNRRPLEDNLPQNYSPGDALRKWHERHQAQLSGMPDDVVPELDSRQMTDWQRFDSQGIDTCVGCGREGQLGESGLCPRCEQGFNGFDKLVGRQAQVMPPSGGGGPLVSKIQVDGYQVEVVDLDGSPEGGNLVFDYVVILPNGDQVTHQSPDGWNSGVIYNDTELDDIGQAQLAEQLGGETMNDFADKVFRVYLAANGASPEEIDSWMSLEGNYTVENGRLVSYNDDPDDGQGGPDGGEPVPPSPVDDPEPFLEDDSEGFDRESQRLGIPEGGEVDENGWHFEHAVTGKSRWIKPVGDMVLEVAQAMPGTISISVLSKADNKIVHREMVRGVGGNAMEHAKIQAESMATAMFGPSDAEIDQAHTINRIIDDADDNLAGLRKELSDKRNQRALPPHNPIPAGERFGAKTAHSVWSVAGGVLERKVPEHKEAEGDEDAMGMPQAPSMMQSTN